MPYYVICCFCFCKIRVIIPSFPTPRNCEDQNNVKVFVKLGARQIFII